MPIILSSPKYDFVPKDEIEHELELRRDAQRNSRWMSKMWSWSMFMILGLAMGFVVGRYSISDLKEGLLEPLGTVTEVWELNNTFAGWPTEESEKAWVSLIPTGRGFVTHPKLAPEISTVSVFHQIHCLHGIRMAYYSNLYQFQRLQNTIEPNEFMEELENSMTMKNVTATTEHIQHCFDFLRRALMCASDTNMEYVDKDILGTNGWGFERKCRDYNSVVEWAEKWKNSTAGGIV